MRENSKFKLFHTILKNPVNTEISACWSLANMFYTFNLHKSLKMLKQQLQVLYLGNYSMTNHTTDTHFPYIHY